MDFICTSQSGTDRVLSIERLTNKVVKSVLATIKDNPNALDTKYLTNEDYESVYSSLTHAWRVAMDLNDELNVIDEDFLDGVLEDIEKIIMRVEDKITPEHQDEE